jgi:hypothetical protein
MRRWAVKDTFRASLSARRLTTSIAAAACAVAAGEIDAAAEANDAADSPIGNSNADSIDDERDDDEKDDGDGGGGGDDDDDKWCPAWSPAVLGHASLGPFL